MQRSIKMIGFSLSLSVAVAFASACRAMGIKFRRKKGHHGGDLLYIHSGVYMQVHFEGGGGGGGS